MDTKREEHLCWVLFWGYFVLHYSAAFTGGGVNNEKNFMGFYSDLRLFTGFSFDATAVRFHGIDAPFRVII